MRIFEGRIFTDASRLVISRITGQIFVNNFTRKEFPRTMFCGLDVIHKNSKIMPVENLYEHGLVWQSCSYNVI